MSITVYGIPNCERVFAVVTKIIAACRGLIVSLLLAASPTAARDMTTYPACILPPAHWVADGAALNEHQTFHQVALIRDGSVRWNGDRTSDARLKSKLRVLGRNRFLGANQVGLFVADGVSCSRVIEVRAMMESALDCRVGMCRAGTLRKPPLPPSTQRSNTVTERRRAE